MFYEFIQIVYFCLIVCINSEKSVYKFNITESVSIEEKYSIIEDQWKENIQDFDWDVWCKFQPNEYDCTGKEAAVSRFYYDIKMEVCKSFNFRFCPNSYNNFKTITDCHSTCRDPGLHLIKSNTTAKTFCRFQPDFGQCNSYHPMFYFDITERVCKGFSYSGCGGNYNRFPSPQICSAVCSSVIEY